MCIQAHKHIHTHTLAYEVPQRFSFWIYIILFAVLCCINAIRIVHH